MRNFSENQPTHTNRLQLLDTFLRLSVIPLSAASIWLTVTNKEDNSTYGRLEFSSLVGLKYMICINAISAGYALVSVVASWLRCLLSKAWAFFVSDQVVTYLMVTSGAAVLEILYLAYNGDKAVSWSEACVSYGRFCSRMKVALILQAIALFCYFLLSLISSYKVFSRFEPPIASKGVVEESN
ncbi:hypothetical protein AQUCO_00500030v1 [Aquilegia coerulea]|uniref:CASP-like protein n=1 Tax=Aquilegia coerulea TaxID=218851 RepID=A0A2G5EQ01_AQUCA|nr:hypothetical protein AQUCO_00500030v1 [Aquilegia coerulea]